MSEENKENEPVELLSGHTIDWWEKLRGTCCAVGVVLTVLIGVFTTGFDQSEQDKDGQKQVEQPRVYVNEKGNLVHRKCDSSGSTLSAVMTISAMIITWGYIWWLRFLIKERIKGEAWWFEGGWIDFNKKLAKGYVVFEAVVLASALVSMDNMMHWRIAWYWSLIRGVVSALAVGVFTWPLFEKIIGKGKTRLECQIERRAMYEVQREAEIKAGKPFRVERWFIKPPKEMTILGAYATLEEAEKRMAEAVEIACKKEQGLGCEEVRKCIDKARRQGYYQMRDADGAITSLFSVPMPPKA